MDPKENKRQIAKQAVYRIIAQLVSVIVVALVGWAVSSFSPTKNIGNDSHNATILALVTRADETGTTLKDIGGYDRVKTDLRRAIVLPLKHPHIFYDEATPSLRPPCGILLTGPPGTGKTLLAKACAKESGANFLSLHAAALESKWWGESPKLLQSAFRLARTSLAPCIVFFDEIDGLGRSRSENDQSCVYSFKCELLRNIDGIDKDADSPVTVLACTNCPDSLDAALKRRFTRTITVDVPTLQERRDILEVVSRKEMELDLPLLDRIAEATQGLTGADLAAAYTEACSHRMWTSSGTEEDLQHFRDGREFIRHMGPLTKKDWTHSGRVRISRQNATAVRPKDRTGSDDAKRDAPGTDTQQGLSPPVDV